MNVGLIIRRTIVVAHRDLLAFYRTFYTEIVSSIMTPILIVIAFRIGIGDSVDVDGTSFTTFLIAGMTMVPVMTSSFTLAGIETFIARKESCTFETYLTLPSPMESYVLGRILSCACLGLIDGSIVGAVSMVVTGSTEYLRFLVALPLVFLCGILFASFGIVGGMLVKWYYQFEAARDLFTLPLMFFSAVYFPLSSLTGVARTFVASLPLTPYVEAWRGLVIQGIPMEAFAADILLALLYPVIAVSASVTIVVWLSKRR